MWTQEIHDGDARDKRSRDLFDPSDQIGKLIRLLSSPVDGEVTGAARALARVLATNGADFHHLADLVESNWRPPTPPPKPHAKQPWQLQAEFLLRHREILLGDRELDFLTNMAKSRSGPTAKQEKWLNDIEARLPCGARMADDGP